MERPDAHEPQRKQTRTENDQSALRPPAHPPEGTSPHDEDHDQLRGYAGVGLWQKEIEDEAHQCLQPPVMNDASHSLESGLGLGLKRLLLWGIPLAVITLIFPAPSPDAGLLTYSLVHLGVLQLAALVFAAEITRSLDRPWFSGIRRPWLASSASLVALVTGFAALLTLATSAAARYDVSLQFLQLLSSLDIAWVTAALFYGARRLAGPVVAWMAATALVVACIGSIAAYLVVVGFTPEGGWQVSSGDLMTIVLPADMTAAIISVTVLLIASRKADQPTAQ